MGRRIAIVGNAGGGKSTLARKLGQSLNLPVFHVDSIQHQPGWKRTSQQECDELLDALSQRPLWIIDGFGSDEVIERRLRLADIVIFIDFPLWLHYWWATRRQWRARHSPRKELPENCPEFTLGYSWKLARMMWLVHTRYRPWFLELIAELPESTEVIHIRSRRGWMEFLDNSTGFGALAP